nr:hypothetical protein SUGSMm_32410 [Morganella morganii subsp. sibonii]
MRYLIIVTVRFIFQSAILSPAMTLTGIGIFLGLRNKNSHGEISNNNREYKKKLNMEGFKMKREIK